MLFIISWSTNRFLMLWSATGHPVMRQLFQWIKNHSAFSEDPSSSIAELITKAAFITI
jgi:Trk-type K+ transport system membrane component